MKWTVSVLFLCFHNVRGTYICSCLYVRPYVRLSNNFCMCMCSFSSTIQRISSNLHKWNTLVCSCKWCLEIYSDNFCWSWPASREKGPLDISHGVDQDQPPNDVENTYTYQTVHTPRKINAIDVTSVKKCRPWPDAASETRRLVWVYTFCICRKSHDLLM